MFLDIYDLGLLLAVTTAVALICERFKIQYTVGLVLAGIALAFLRVQVDLPLSKAFVYTFLLPPLVFEAAVRIQWPQLRRELPVVLTLAGPGLLASALVLAAGMHWSVGWSWTTAALFGVLISATDPVAVVATFDEAKVKGRVNLLVRAESLANDGTAAAVFVLLLSMAVGAAPTPIEIVWRTLLTVGGGVACGVVVAGALLYLVGRTGNHLIEITLTTLCAYGSFLLAERIGASGVLASVAAGMMVAAAERRGAFSATGRTAVGAFWEYIAFLANSVVFILIGVTQASRSFLPALAPAFIAVLLAVVGRAVAVYPFCALFRGSRLAVAPEHQHVLFWGGFRGALPLALAIGLPEEIANRDTLITATFAVVAFSVFVQTLLMIPLLHRLGVIRPTSPFEGESAQ